MKLSKAAWPLTFVLALAACSDDAEKFEGVWKSDMGLFLLINDGATEATLCIPGFGSGPEMMKVSVDGNKLKSVEFPSLSVVEWREVDGTPRLDAEGQMLGKVDQAEWDKNCK